MKNPWEWNESDLLQLVEAGTKESVELDFKESPSLQNNDHNKNEISKDISALANSAGGTIIYGMKEDGHVATEIDGGVDPHITTKEWLEQVINSRIHRKVDGIRINQVELTTTNKGNVAYVVYVPYSNRAPHQAYDKKFYKRYNFESVPMEEYEVRDASRREEVPHLVANFILPSSPFQLQQEADKPANLPLCVTISNKAIEPANYAVIVLYIDARLEVANSSGMDLQKDLFLQLGEKRHKVHILRENWSIPGKIPIFNGIELQITSEPIIIKINDELLKKEGSYVVGYEIRSPKMTPQQSFKILRIQDGKATFDKNYLSSVEFITSYDDLGL